MTDEPSNVTKLPSPLDPKMPYLDEATEFRRMMDNKRAEAMARIDTIDNDLAAMRMQLEQMQEARKRLQLIVDVCAQGLVIIPGPRDGGAS